MIVTPENLIKQYFPEPIETTRNLYNRLELDESGYSYLRWLKDLEDHCLTKYVDDLEYKLLPDIEKNYWISPKAFQTIIQSSPSKICDQIRACISDIAKRVAQDPAFARQLQDQYDQEAGIEQVVPKVSKTLKSKYNKSGQDAFEFSVHADTRLYMDIISGYNFQPGQKIKDVSFVFNLEVEKGVPFHIIDMRLLLTNEHNLTFRTVWCCNEERQVYAAILTNKMIRINLFEDNKKLVDSFDYILKLSELKTLELDLEKVIILVQELKLDDVNVEELGEIILSRHNLNEQAYVQAIKAAFQSLSKDQQTESADMIETAFLNALNQYWENCVLQSTAAVKVEDMEQMVKNRIPKVTLALTVANMLNYDDLCNKYFKHSYSNKQKQALLSDARIRLIYALSIEKDFDITAAPDKQLVDVCAFIADQLDLMKNILIDMGQWPSN